MAPARPAAGDPADPTDRGRALGRLTTTGRDPQALPRRLERLEPLAEREPQQVRAAARVGEERRPRHGRDPDVLDEVVRGRRRRRRARGARRRPSRSTRPAGGATANPVSPRIRSISVAPLGVLARASARSSDVGQRERGDARPPAAAPARPPSGSRAPSGCPPSAVGAAIAQPTRQPVTVYVFDSALIVTVRSSMPGSVAIGTCRRPS